MSIQVNNLSKSYTDLKALDHVDFSIKKGEIVGFLGPNGAGKSTLMKILTGFIKEFEGEVFINEKSVSDFPIATKKNIGYLPERNPLYSEMYVREYLDFHALIYQVKKEAIERIIKEVGLSSHASKKVKELSKGYRQRLGLATALLHEPDVLILDEPTTGLDPNQLAEIRSLIKKVGENKTVLFSTHIMQEVEAVCDRVIIINKGKIVTDQSLSDLHSENTQIIEVEFDKQIKENIFNLLPDFTKSIQKEKLTYEIYFSGNEDRRASIFDLAQQNNLKILSMFQNTQDLEKLFQDLTRQ